VSPHLPSGVELAAAVSTLAALPVAAALATAGGGRAGSARRAYRLLAAGVLLAALSTVAGAVVARLLAVDWTVRRAPGALDPDSLLLAAVLVGGGAMATMVLLAGLVRLPGLAISRGELLRLLLDALVIAGGCGLVAWVLIADPTRVLGDATPQQCKVVLSGAAFTAVAVALAIILPHRSAPGSVRRAAYSVAAISAAGPGLAAGVRCAWPALVLLGAGVLPLAMVVLGWSARGADRSAGTGPVAAGPPDRRAAGREPPPDVLPELVRDDPLRRRAGRGSLPGSTVGVFVPVLAVAAVVYHMASGGAIEPFGAGAGLVEGLALVARQHLTLRDARRSTARLAEREARLWTLAHTDPLTGLMNRRGLLKELYDQACDGPPCVLLGLDLDGFKNINDMRGHDVGDAVLAEVGRRLRTNLRPGDVAARLGGDEFAVLMWAEPAEARWIAERLLSVLSRPYVLATGTVFMSASIGLAARATAPDVPSLLRNADLALRYAKQRGKCRVEQYAAEYEQRLVRRTTLEHELRGAIDRDELHVAYQPVVVLPSARTAGAEALLRWHHPTLGTVPPDEFIAVAEESGMIVRLGGFVLHQACHQLSLWLAAGHDVWMSVNVSPYELHSPEYVRQVVEVLRAHRVPPQRLVLEVTEQVVAPDRDEMVRRLTALRHTGVRIALDDFGAGYNSLGQLRNLPVDILKIDHSLVAELDPARGRSAKPLVDVVAEIGHRLGLEVIAEGVVVPEQRDLVVRAGCRFAQGEMYGRAVPAEHLEALLAAGQQPPARLPVQHLGSVDSSHEMRQA
jgi:diguanylate cyclase (GGDEF)-like protein